MIFIREWLHKSSDSCRRLFLMFFFVYKVARSDNPVAPYDFIIKENKVKISSEDKNTSFYVSALL